jgi:hypothetical protein
MMSFPPLHVALCPPALGAVAQPLIATQLLAAGDGLGVLAGFDFSGWF